ncbi:MULTISPECIES: hypothetical protein [Nocardia]|uniref:WXG100 family type VII secretion target n=1 Tax=Nocardia sputorum TaxID=2984338 RepID=A0ABN6UB61_9NOCA|nr:hypothetical protein [Nocardia sputorum]BDT94282.1 hypothetical protein IFM12275_42580 [Nocardia sputorum]BDU02473.1 hypothetical protein IFM12276_55010 [Nocardia sputorum]
MADNVEFDEHLFRKAAQKTGHVQDRITGIIDRLSTSIAARGNCWGNDTIGRNFANGPDGSGGYTTTRDNLIKGARNVAGTFENFSEGQTETADLLRDMEHGNRDGIR